MTELRLYARDKSVPMRKLEEQLLGPRKGGTIGWISLAEKGGQDRKNKQSQGRVFLSTKD